MDTKTIRREYTGHPRWYEPTRTLQAEILMELAMWMEYKPVIIQSLKLIESKTAPDGYVELLIEYEAKQ